MTRLTHMFCRVAAGVALAVTFGITSAVWAAVTKVPPGDGPFGAAIAASQPGDTLILQAGIHKGGVVIDHTLVVTGEAGAIVEGGGVGRTITVSAPNTVIRNLTVQHSGDRLDLMDAGIYLDKNADDSIVENNRLVGNLFGVYVQGPERVIVRNNEIIGRTDLRVNERGNGVQMWNTPGTVVEGNSVRYGRDGIFVTTSNHNAFRNNTFTDLRFAIHYMYTNHSEISGNVSIGNHVGYALMFSHHLKVIGNKSTNDRDHGFLLNYANGSAIERNIARNGKTKCVFIYNSNKNRFIKNRFEGCAIGVHFTAGSERNVISQNAFVGNQTQVKYVGTRWLEWSHNGLGNYWSDNPAFDLDGDQVADTAYRPNDMVDQIVWRAPAAKVLLTSPAVQLLRWAQSQFPGLLPGGVIDSSPLMKPANMADNAYD